MRFALPITESGEMETLLRAGADEFYCGYLEPEWRERWGGHDSISRRQGKANVGDRAQLELIAHKARRLGAPVWLALNGCYSPPQYGYLLELTRGWTAWGGSGVILRDLRFLRLVKELKAPPRVSLSLLAVAANSAAARFFKSQGVERIVLPRFIQPREMGEMIAAAPDLEYEAMVMDDGCPMVDGYCRSIHGCAYPPRTGGEPAQLCVAAWDISGSAHHLCQELGLAAAQPACAVCALPMLAQAGVRVGKFGGRGTTLRQRLDKLRFLRAAQEMECDGDRADLYRRSFGPCNCYYGRAASAPGETEWR